MQNRRYNIYFIAFAIFLAISIIRINNSPVAAKLPVNYFNDINLPRLMVVSDTIIRDTIRKTQDTTKVDSLAPKPVFTDVITFSADDSIQIDMNSKSINLYKNANIKYITTELKADNINLNMTTNEAFAQGVKDSLGKIIGKPHFKDKGQEFDSKSLKYNFKTKKGYVKEIVTQQGEGYVQGKITKQMNDSVFCVKDGWYTTCDNHDHPHFYIRMSRAKLIKGDKVVSGFANLVIEDVPLPLFIPFGFFPITTKRTSGIIIPTYGEESIRGFNLRDGGYYWAINKHMDASFLGTIYSNGSWRLGLTSQYRKRYKFSGSLQFTTSKSKAGDKGYPDYSETKDWSLRWTHSQDSKANPYATFSASVDLSSSTNDYYNAQTISDIANQRKQSSVSWSKKWPDKPYSLSASFSHSQNSTDSTISLSLPNMNFTVSQIYPFRRKVIVGDLKWYENIGVSYTASLKSSVNTKEDFITKTFSDVPRYWKSGFKHNIPLSTSINIAKDVSISPSFNYTGVGFLKKIHKEWVIDGPTTNIGHIRTDTIYGLQYAHNYSASVSMSYNPTIYGMFLFTNPDSKIYAIRHVISPSISTSYTPEMGIKRNKYWKKYVNGDGKEIEYSIFEGQLYSPPSGATESGSMSLSLDNSLEMKVRNDRDTSSKEEYKKIKLIESLRASTSYNFFADSMKWSNISLSFRTKIFKDKINISLSGTLDPYAIDSDGNRYNKYNGGLGRLTSLSGSSGISFSSEKGNKGKGNDSNEGDKNSKKGKGNNPSEGDKDAINNNNLSTKYSKFSIPWSVNIDYTFSYNRTYLTNPEEDARKPLHDDNINMTFRVNGNFSLTPKWIFNFSSGYDVKAKNITATSFSVKRDLHCWTMSFTCIPFGTHQSYSFQINVKSSLLKDLKLDKQDSWYDNRDI